MTFNTSSPTGAPERGALLRRDGSSTAAMAKWRKLRRTGALHAWTPPRPGPQPARRDPPASTNEQRWRAHARRHARRAQADAIIEVKKRCAAAWGQSALAGDRRAVLQPTVPELAPRIGVAGAWRALGGSRSSS